MAIQLINLGTPDGNDGDAIRDAFQKVNNNFNELYNLEQDVTNTIVTIALGGDLSGEVTFSPQRTSTETLTATILPNSVALGTDTTGNYVESLIAGTGVTITRPSGIGVVPQIAIGQNVAPSASPTFARMSLTDLSLGIVSNNQISTFAGDLILDAATDLVRVSNNLSVGGELAINNIEVNDSLVVNGEFVINGDFSFNANITSDLKPGVSKVYDLGSSDNVWDTLYVGSVVSEEIISSIIDCGKY